MSIKKNKIDLTLYIILFGAFSLQNKTVFNITVLQLGNIWLNIYDAVIIICLFILIFRMVYLFKTPITKMDWFLVFIILFFFALGVASGNQISNLAYNARSFVYLIFMYLITKNLFSDIYLFYKILSFGSFLCVTIYFYSFFTSSNFNYDEYVRLVSFNFPIVLLFMVFTLHVMKFKKISLFSMLNILYGAASIITTQTRTLIVPMSLILGIFLCYVLIDRKISRLTKTFLISLGFGLFYVLLNSGLGERILNRLNQVASGEESTLNLRIDSVLYNFEEQNVFEKLIGSGLGSEILYFSAFTSDLYDTFNMELFLGDYLIKFGFLGAILIVAIYFTIYFKNAFKYDIGFNIGLAIILFSLSISGLSGYTGHLFLGLVLGGIANRQFAQKNKIPSVPEKKLNYKKNFIHN